MAKEPVKFRDPESYVTFDDIFALALAETEATRYTADPHKWQSALYSIWKKYKDNIPALKAMSFDESCYHVPPQSEEFYQLLSILSSSKLISLPNPDFEYILMDPDQKLRAKGLEEDLLQEYKEEIEDIGQMLASELKA